MVWLVHFLSDIAVRFKILCVLKKTSEISERRIGPMEQLWKTVRENWQLTRFLLIGFLGYLAWHLLYTFYLREHTLLDEVVIQTLVVMAEGTMKALGWELLELFEVGAWRNRIGLAGGGGLVVGTSCDGVALFALFAIFVMAYPGDWKRKVWFIPLGIVAIHVANYIRVMGLMLIQRYTPEALDFNHHYTFTVFVYAIIFGLWYLWAMKLSPVASAAPVKSQVL